ncbi:hypothetical protein [Nocardioides sp.]|uniref:hypothetical protein n=1 Tax=Nocardioides sp. TaxID=35761 RepID=UPI002628E947|nr:hypothetical protein [Nocardioides sp.]
MSDNDNGLGEPEFWFCLKHHTVEGPEGCKAKDRLGPYPTEAEAANALNKVAERNEEWESDPKWNDTGDDSGNG